MTDPTTTDDAAARAADELRMAADALTHCVENPEMPWAQGVMFAVEALLDRADALSPPPGGPAARVWHP